jgi:hypothetical protein
MAEKPHKQNIVKMQSRAEKVANQPIGQGKMYSASLRAFPLKNRSTFPLQELRKNCENREVLCEQGLPRSKRQR